MQDIESLLSLGDHTRTIGDHSLPDVYKKWIDHYEGVKDYKVNMKGLLGWLFRATELKELTSMIEQAKESNDEVLNLHEDGCVCNSIVNDNNITPSMIDCSKRLRISHAYGTDYDIGYLKFCRPTKDSNQDPGFMNLLRGQILGHSPIINSDPYFIFNYDDEQISCFYGQYESPIKDKSCELFKRIDDKWRKTSLFELYAFIEAAKNSKETITISGKFKERRLVTDIFVFKRELFAYLLV